MARELVRIEGLEGAMRTLRALPKELVSQRGGPVRFALRKAAQVLQKQVQANLRGIILEPNADGAPSESTGLLEKNVVVKRGGEPKGQKGERALVAIRKKAYPLKSPKAKPTSTPQIARLLEYGDERKRAHPFIRPAFDAKKVEATTVFSFELNRRLGALVKRVEREQGAKT